MFYVLIFSLLAVVLVVGGIAGMSRRRRTMEGESANVPSHTVHHGGDDHRARKAKRAQSRHDRRKRH